VAVEEGQEPSVGRHDSPRWHSRDHPHDHSHRGPPSHGPLQRWYSHDQTQLPHGGTSGPSVTDKNQPLGHFSGFRIRDRDDDTTFIVIMKGF
jgi:hypothetical protein